MAKLLLYTEIEQAEEYAGGVSVLEMRLKEASDRSTKVNAEEKLFDEELTDFGEIANVYKVFEPYAALWTNTAAFAAVEPTWMHGTFDKLDAAAMSESISNWLKYMNIYIHIHIFICMYLNMNLVCVCIHII